MARLGHIGDLLACVRSFDAAAEGATEDTAAAAPAQRLSHLLQHMVLMTDVDFVQQQQQGKGRAAPPPKPCVTLSTVHGAKGMEWDAVFVVGVEASLFPHVRSVGAEEERAVTAASPSSAVDEARPLPSTPRVVSTLHLRPLSVCDVSACLCAL